MGYPATCEDAEHAMLSVVNSPRMGVRAYEGGTIALQRGRPASS